MLRGEIRLTSLNSASAAHRAHTLDPDAQRPFNATAAPRATAAFPRLGDRGGRLLGLGLPRTRTPVSLLEAVPGGVVVGDVAGNRHTIGTPHVEHRRRHVRRGVREADCQGRRLG